MKQCTAKSKRSGKRCQRLPSIGREVCAMHGGKSLAGVAHPNFKTGKTSKYAYLPERLTARVEELAGDVIRNLEESINIQRALESELLAKVGTGESPDAWKAMAEILNDGETAPETKLVGIRAIVSGALGEDSLHQRIRASHEIQRKLTESLTKCRKEIQETYTQEQWNMMLTLVTQAAKTAVTDRIMLNNFISELDVYRNFDKQKPGLLAA